ncbi:lipopolysaccharide biosynthesis protein [Roseomonas sp. BN140053]|uniref:lipopolysaccharide biosynthesis protein n=1 Tax=Roseomonas sp. BN140053 TaxID=3391898 RepID=UPI0039E852C9
MTVQPPRHEPDEEAAASRNLKSASASGIVINLTSQFALFGLRLVFQIVLARFLLPGDFGLVAMVAPVITFVGMFADLGLSQATVQQKNISQEQLSFLFWVNATAGLMLAGLCVACADLVAGFYGDARVANIMIVSGSLLFVTSLCSQHLALLNRHLRFRALAILNLVSFFCGALAGVVSAILGMGYWAIMMNQAVFSITIAVLAWSVSRWLPGRPAPFASMKPLLHFSSDVTSYRFVNFFSRSSDSVMLGRFAGEHALGLYDRAIKLMLLPFFQFAGPFTSVAIPLLSRTQDQPEFYRRAFSRMLGAVVLLIYPSLIFMIINSYDLTALALGQQWVEVAPIFMILGIDAFVAPIGNSMGWLFISQGRTREMRNWGILTSVLFVACFAIGLSWGAKGVAAGYAAAGLLEMSFLWRVATRRGPLRGQDLFSAVAPFLFASLITFGVMYGVLSALPAGILGLLLKAAGAYAVFAAALAVLPGGRRALRDFLDQALQLVARFRSM